MLFMNASKTYIEMLEVYQRKALRIVTGCSRTTPINTLSAIAAIEPMKFKLEFLTKKIIAKHHSRNSFLYNQLSRIKDKTNASEKHLTYMESVYLKNIDEFNMIAKNEIITTAIDNINIHDELANIRSKKNMNQDEIRSIALEEIKTKYKNHYRIYTDASKQNQECSIGIYDSRKKQSISSKLSNSVSIMSAEINAIMVAVNYIIFHQIQNAVIFTDSKSSCLYIKKHQKLNKYNEVISNITRLNKHCTIQWVPAHVGLVGNEKADQLAKDALIQSEQIHVNKLLLDDATRNFKQHKYKQHNEWYITTATRDGKGTKFYSFQNQISLKPWFNKMSFNNIEQRKLNRLVSGHDFSSYWLAKMRIKESPLCDVCGVDETTQHIVTECVKYTHIQSKYVFFKKTWNEIINKFNEQSLRDVLKYLKEICYEI